MAVGTGLTNVQKIQDTHKSFMLLMLARASMRPIDIHAMLSNADDAAEYGFEPISVTSQRVAEVLRIMQRTHRDEILNLQADFMADFSTMPLAHKKNRVEQLSAMYFSVDKITSGVDKKGEPRLLAEDRRVHLKRQLLRDIKDEIGEDVEKLAEALRAGSNTFVNVSLTHQQRTELAFVLQDKDRPTNGDALRPTNGDALKPTNGGAN